MLSKRTKTEITKEEFEALKATPGAEFDGMRVTMPEKMRGGVWNKPIAAQIEDKFFRIDDK